MNVLHCHYCRAAAVVEGTTRRGVPVRTCSACGSRERARRTQDWGVAGDGPSHLAQVVAARQRGSLAWHPSSWP